MKKLFMIAISIAAFVSCKEEQTVTPTSLTAVTKTDINATYTNYQYFSFATGDTVPFSDSTTTNWDIAFKGTTVIINGGTSGPGVGGAVILDTLFSEVTSAPTSGYAQDGLTKAIPTGSNNGWYNYAGPPNQQKLDQLEKALVDLWDVMSPQLRSRKLLWDKFFNLQTRVRLMNLKMGKELKNETDK